MKDASTLLESVLTSLVYAARYNPGEQDAAPALYRIEATCGPGNGVKILNAPVPPPFRESVRFGEQNLYSQAKTLVGDRDPRNHEFSVQLRAMDTDRMGHGLGLPVSARRLLLELPDEMATKVNIVFYADPADAFTKAILE